MRRYGRLAAAVAALLATVALVATVHAASVAGAEHSPGGHGSGHDADALVVCVAAGACVLAVVGTAVGVRRLVQRPLWLLRAPLTPAMPLLPAPAMAFSRAGPPPPLLQVFRF